MILTVHSAHEPVDRTHCGSYWLYTAVRVCVCVVNRSHEPLHSETPAGYSGRKVQVMVSLCRHALVYCP